MKSKKVMIGGVAFVLFAAVFWFYIKPNYISPAAPVVFTDEQIAAAKRPTVFLGKSNSPEEKKGAGADGLILNLKAPAATPAYAKVIIALEFADPEHHYVGVGEAALPALNEAFAHALKPEMHKILDSVTSVFGSKSPDQAASTEGREQLKVELIEAINHHLHEQKVTAIYFETFITQ